jgi:hypothetical protein
MLPNATLDGFGTTDVLAVPDPCTANEVAPFITTAPPSAPVVVGLKVTFTDKLAPGASVSGKAGWLARYPVLAVIVEIVKPLVPLLVTVSGNVSDLPTTTSPNCKLTGLNDKWVEAAAGAENPAIKRKAISDRKNAHL